MSVITQSLLNNDDVKIVLHNHYEDDNYEITKVKLVPYFNSINGFLGQHISLIVELKRNGKLLRQNFFAKYLPPIDSPLYRHAIDGNCYNKEIFFYTTFTDMAKRYLRNLNVRIAPKMLHSQDGMVIFEDMGLDGYKSVSYLDVTEDHITNAVHVIAKFHAIGFAVEKYKAKALKCTSYKLIDEFPDAFQEPLFKSNINSVPYKISTAGRDATIDLIDFLSDKLTRDEISKFKTDYRLQYEKMTNIFQNGDQKYNRVLSHGDLWLNNLLYKYDDTGKIADCLMVDFQYIRYAPPAHDVTFAIYYSSNKELRCEKFDHFLRVYYQYLTNELNRYDLDINDICPIEEYEESCKLYLTIAKIIKGIYAPVSALPQERLQDIASKNEDYHNYLIEDRRPLARKFMQEEPSFYDVIIENLMDIYEGIRNDKIE